MEQLANQVHELSDDGLLERLKMGDIEALEPLYVRYRGVVNAVLRQSGRLTGPEAEDLCHDVFLTLKEVAGRYRPGNSLRGWLCGIAMKKARRLRQGQWLRDRLLLRTRRPAESGWLSTPVEHRLDVERLLRCLSAPLREVVILSLLEQMTGEDIAAALDISVNTVWTRLHRARERIRELAEGEGA